jgi:two-component system nitrogen regulation sensor histidine kinase GlnL
MTADPLSLPAEQMLDAMATAVVVLDSKTEVLYVNAAAEVLLDTSRRRATGRNLGDFLPISDAVLSALAKAGETASPVTLRELTLGSDTQTEEDCVVDCVVTPIGSATRAELLLEFSRVDPVSRLARETWLDERQAATQYIIRGLAHEINNPLGGIRGAAQLLDRELPRGDLREFTRIITHEADRLKELVERMSQPYRAAAPVPLNVHEVLEHVRQLTLLEVREGITIERDYDPSLPEIDGVKDQLIQAVLNIVRNARQAMEDRGVIRLRTRIRRQFTLGARQFRHVVQTEIRDDGPGIPQELASKIFLPMVTGRAEGTGLGLAIAEEIINRHGGKIECRSRPGDTCFTFYLPVPSP